LLSGFIHLLRQLHPKEVRQF